MKSSWFSMKPTVSLTFSERSLQQPRFRLLPYAKVLGFDSTFVSSIVLSKNRPFSKGFRRISGKKVRSLSKLDRSSSVDVAAKGLRLRPVMPPLARPRGPLAPRRWQRLGTEAWPQRDRSGSLSRLGDPKMAKWYGFPSGLP